MDLLIMKKRTLFSKIQAVRAHESERVSWASQLSLQTLHQRTFDKVLGKEKSVGRATYAPALPNDFLVKGGSFI